LIGWSQNVKKALRISNVQTPLSNTDVLLEGGCSLVSTAQAAQEVGTSSSRKRTRGSWDH